MAERAGFRCESQWIDDEWHFAENLLNTAQIIILVLDTQGRIVQFNPYLEEICGYSLAEVTGKDWFSVFVPEPERESRSLN